MMTLTPVLVGVLLLYIYVIVRGWKKGFVRMAASIACVVLSLLAARILSPAVAQTLMERPEVAGWVESSVMPYLKEVNAQMVVTAVAFVLLFIVALAGTKLAASVLNLIAGLPVISFFNHVAGGLFGLAEATVYVWVFMLAVTALSRFSMCRDILAQIDASEFLTILYVNNPLITMVKSIAG